MPAPHIKAPIRYLPIGSNRRIRVSFDGDLDSTNYGDIQSDVISGTPTMAHTTDLTSSSIQATTAAMTIDGSTVSAGRGVLGRLVPSLSALPGTVVNVVVTINTTLGDTIKGICPVKIVAGTS